MARVNVEQRGFADSRLMHLGMLLGGDVAKALGHLVWLWHGSQQRLQVEATEAEIRQWACGYRDPALVDHLVTAGYLVPLEGGLFRISGNEEAIGKMKDVTALRKMAATERWAKERAKDRKVTAPKKTNGQKAAMQTDAHACTSMHMHTHAMQTDAHACTSMHMHTHAMQTDANACKPMHTPCKLCVEAEAEAEAWISPIGEIAEKPETGDVGPAAPGEPPADAGMPPAPVLADAASGSGRLWEDEPTQPQPDTPPEATTGRSDPKSGGVLEDAQPPSQALVPVKAERAKKKQKATDEPTPTALVWRAYRQSMMQCWKQDPPSSRAVMGMAKRLVEMVGAEKAQQLAVYYPTRRDPKYIAMGHPFEMILKDHMRLLREIGTGYKLVPQLVKHIAEQEVSRELDKLHEDRVMVNPMIMTDKEFEEYNAQCLERERVEGRGKLQEAVDPLQLEAETIDCPF